MNVRFNNNNIEVRKKVNFFESVDNIKMYVNKHKKIG
jgi:hypothetical protein